MLRTTIAQGPAPTVFLAGEMDLDCADTLREAVAEAARGAQMVVLDFAGVEFIDSSGTGIFVRLCLDMKSQGTPLLARNLGEAAPPRVLRPAQRLHPRKHNERRGIDGIAQCG
jgi:anti-anti-sigma factor